MSQENGHDKFLTVSELAAIFNVSTRWIFRKMDTNTLPIRPIRLGDRTIRFDPVALDEYRKRISASDSMNYEVDRYLAIQDAKKRRRQKKKEVTQ